MSDQYRAEYNLKVNGPGGVQAVKLICRHDTKIAYKVYIELVEPNQRPQVFEAENYFRALIKLRLSLEPCAERLICYGASLNVHPSPMIEPWVAPKKHTN